MKQLFTLITAVLCIKAYAQHIDTLKKSPVRTLTDQQYAAYLKGEDLNRLDLAASINFYPLPDEVLQQKMQLKLTAEQTKQLSEQSNYLLRKKLEIGNSIVHNERTLDSLFRTRKANDGNIIFYANRYGLYEGEMRTAILLACYKARAVLTAAQLNKFTQLKKP